MAKGGCIVTPSDIRYIVTPLGSPIRMFAVAVYTSHELLINCPASNYLFTAPYICLARLYCIIYSNNAEWPTLMIIDMGPGHNRKDFDIPNSRPIDTGAPGVAGRRRIAPRHLGYSYRAIQRVTGQRTNWTGPVFRIWS